MQLFTKSYRVDLLLAFYMAFLKFIRLVVLSALLFHRLTPITSYLVSILQPISTNHYTVKDSLSFADWAKKYKHKNGIMCSLDVSSLFTNVPLEETLNICLDKLYSLADPPALPRVVLRKLLEFATKKSHFLFDGKYYDQIDGEGRKLDNSLG